MPLHIIILQVLLYLVLAANLAGIVITVRARWLTRSDQALFQEMDLEGTGGWTFARWYWFFVVTPLNAYSCYLLSTGRGHELFHHPAAFGFWIFACFVVFLIYSSGWHDLSKAFRKWGKDDVVERRIKLSNQIDGVFLFHVFLWVIATLGYSVTWFVHNKTGA